MSQSDKYREKLTVDQIARNQWERINDVLGQGIPESFENSVKGYLSTISPPVKKKVRKREKEYTENYVYYRYEYNCGVPIGTPDKPKMRNGKPYSPVQITETIVDYYKLFDVIQEELFNAGHTWSRVDSPRETPQ